MPFTPDERESDGMHAWAAIRRTCRLEDEDDPFMSEVVRLFREAYGEERILALAADPGVEATFDLSAIRNAIRQGLPEASAEGDKPPALTNYRSESAEILARGALAQAHGLEFPTSPQQGKSNANMPILGFDGWGIDQSQDDYRLVLVQVKGTDDEARPPREAQRLCEECQRIPIEVSKLSRALSILVVFLDGTEHLEPLLGMLETLGRDELPALTVAPVVVRGIVTAELADLTPLRTAADKLLPTRSLGVSISVGIDLTEFGRAVTSRARAA